MRSQSKFGLIGSCVDGVDFRTADLVMFNIHLETRHKTRTLRTQCLISSLIGQKIRQLVKISRADLSEISI